MPLECQTGSGEHVHPNASKRIRTDPNRSEQLQKPRINGIQHSLSPTYPAANGIACRIPCCKTQLVDRFVLQMIFFFGCAGTVGSSCLNFDSQCAQGPCVQYSISSDQWHRNEFRARLRYVGQSHCTEQLCAGGAANSGSTPGFFRKPRRCANRAR